MAKLGGGSIVNVASIQGQVDLIAASTRLALRHSFIGIRSLFNLQTMVKAGSKTLPSS